MGIIDFSGTVHINEIIANCAHLFDGLSITVPLWIPLVFGTSLSVGALAQSGRIPVNVLSHIPVLDLDLCNK